MSVQLSNTSNSQNEAQNDWELSKENFQPLKAGRKPGGLKDNTVEFRKQLVEEQRRAFWEEIAGNQGDDPLVIWLRFIKWTQENFQAGGHKAELLPLLEKCTRELQAIPKYRNDIRYLRVWVQYADCLPEPGDVFSFLKENGIGLDHALYYIAYATYLEFSGSYAKADSVYQQGINRLATPVDRLKGKFQEFQHRMARRIQRKAQEQQAGPGEPDHPARQSLGTIAARRPTQGGLPGPAGMKRKAAGTPSKEAGNENAAGAGLSVFVDDEFTADAAPSHSAPAAAFLPGRTAAGPWAKLGSFEQGKKENTQRATVWAGQKLKQKPVKSAPPAPRLEIFADPEFEDAAGTDALQRVDVVQPSLRQRLEKSSHDSQLDEYLANDPLRLHRALAPEPGAGAGGNSSGSALQTKQTSNPEAKRRKEEVMAFCENTMSVDGEELSFEELRARAWLKSATGENQHVSTKFRPKAALPNAARPIAAENAALNSSQNEQQSSHPPSTSHAHQDQPLEKEHPQHQADARRKSSAHLAEPTMTIATRDAFAAINNMFKGSLPAEFSALPPNPYSEPTMHGYEPTMTLATRNAFAAINNMFKGSLKNEHGVLPPRAGPAEPTVTINTKAAFEAINSMFGNKTSSQGHAEAASGLNIREDTQYLAPAAKQEAAGGFCIQEDTQYLASAAKQEAAGGFCIREDTQYLASAAKQEAAGGFCIREDTQYLAPAAKQEAEFCTREGTDFVAPKPKRQGLQVHKAHDSPAAAQLSKWGFAPGCEDTLQLTLGATETLDGLPKVEHAEAGQLSTGLTAHMHDLCISQDDGKENCGAPQNMPACTRKEDLAGAALQPLQLHPTESGVETDALLSKQGVVQQDSFDVTCDDSAEQQPLAVDPFDTRFQPSMLSSLEPPVLQWPGVNGCSAKQEAETRQALNTVQKSKSSAQISIGGNEYEVKRFVGAGSYATVYEASTADGSLVALKLELPPCPWEWYICQALHARISEQQRHAFIDPVSLVMGPSASILVLPFGPCGSVQDLINHYRKKGQFPEEVVAMHFAMEMLNLLDGLCNSRIVHSDIKPDNLLIHIQRRDAENDENAAPLVQLQLIDFGRSIDLELLPPNALLQGDSGTDAFRCVEMREGNPWLYQADCYSVCGVLHCLLFGEYMQVDRVRDSAGNISLRLRQGWKRYWAQNLWEALFSTLLNHTDTAAPPPIAGLMRQFESHMEQNPTTKRKLNQELRKLVNICQC